MFKDSLEWQTNFYLSCWHTLLEHQMMEESVSSVELADGIKTELSICELIELFKTINHASRTQI